MVHPGLERVLRGIREAAVAAGRDSAAITLVAVSKTFAACDIAPVIEAGQTVFGENRVQEAKAKWPSLKAGHSGVQLHLVGPLQSNKTADAVALFDAIHTIDRPKIAQAIAVEIKHQATTPELFIQVNTGREPQKAGVIPDDTDRFIAHCRDVLELDIAGLMCIPPVAEDPKPHFKLLATIARRNSLVGLSMGMSADYDVAINCGATHVRIGSAIFGRRS